MTHDEATKKQCHIAGRGECVGTQCMAWGWLSFAKLSHVSRIKIAGDEYCKEEPSKDSIPPVAAFRSPNGDGWIAGSPKIEEDEDYGFVFELDWERDTDPQQQGHCSLISNKAICEQLDRICDCLDSIQNAIVDAA